MKVIILPSDPSWVVTFQKYKASLETILSSAPHRSIVHVGSTSVPGLIAKPVLDVDIIVTLDELPAVCKALVDAGYFDCGEMNIPGRFAFRQPGFGQGDAAFGHHDDDMRINTYAMVEGCLALRNHYVKRILLEDKELREEYAKVKTELATKDFARIGEYVFGKNDILVRILQRAGWSEEDLEEVRKVNRI